MPQLSRLTDASYADQPETIDSLPVEPLYNPDITIGGNGIPTRITVRPQEPDPAFNDFNASVGTKLDDMLNKLTGANGQQRYQLWPEKVVREGLSAAGDVVSGQVLQWSIDKDTGEVHTSPQMIEKAQEISALAGTGGLAGGAEGAALNATPSLRPALKYKDKIYKGKEGQQHQDVIPKELYPEFEQMAMNGEDISHYNFGFMNHKGQFLDREKALKYAINEGLVDAHAGQYGALTSTLMADSSKPGVAIEAMGKSNLDNAWWHGSASGDLRGGSSGLHLGTKKAATQALEARIGIPADGKGWTGNREYGKTLLAGQDTLKKMDPKGYNITGHNARNIPKEDYYPTEIKKYPDGTEMPMTVKPEVAPYRLKGNMSNTAHNPHEDFKANGYMQGQLKRGNAKNGYFYKNVGEDGGSISITVPNGSHVEKILKADSSKEGAALQANKPQIKLEKESTGRFYLKDNDGKELGRLAVDYHKGALNIINISTKDGANSIGSSAVKDTLSQLLKHYPDATEIGGFRVSGARANAGNKGDYVEFKFKPVDHEPDFGDKK